MELKHFFNDKQNLGKWLYSKCQTAIIEIFRNYKQFTNKAFSYTNKALRCTAKTFVRTTKAFSRKIYQDKLAFTYIILYFCTGLADEWASRLTSLSANLHYS